MLKAREIMRAEPRIVGPDMTVDELSRLFFEQNSTGFPVVDASGKLHGVVTENDLISRNKKLHIPTVMRLFDAFIILEGLGALEQEIKKISGRTVADICTTDVVTITEDTPLDEIATIMTEQRFHHLPVMRDGKVVGMVDQHDVLRGIAGDSSKQGG